MKNFLLVGLGGLIGSVARYALGLLFSKIAKTDFPWGTFAVNISGCLLMGVFIGYSVKQNWVNEQWQMFFIIGFCGGFTTFSSFAFENISMLQQQNFSGFILYATGSVLLGLLAIWGGLYLAKT